MEFVTDLSFDPATSTLSYNTHPPGGSWIHAEDGSFVNLGIARTIIVTQHGAKCFAVEALLTSGTPPARLVTVRSKEIAELLLEVLKSRLPVIEQLTASVKMSPAELKAYNEAGRPLNMLREAYGLPLTGDDAEVKAEEAAWDRVSDEALSNCE